MACASPIRPSTSRRIAECLGREWSRGSQVLIQPAKSPLRNCRVAYSILPTSLACIWYDSEGLCWSCFMSGLGRLFRFDFFDMLLPTILEFPVEAGMNDLAIFHCYFIRFGGFWQVFLDL